MPYKITTSQDGMTSMKLVRGWKMWAGYVVFRIKRVLFRNADKEKQRQAVLEHVLPPFTFVKK